MIKEKISILGCGWLGLPLAEHLIKNGHPVNGSTTTRSRLKELKAKGINPFLVDLKDLKNSTDFLDASTLIVAITSKELSAYKELIEKIVNSKVKKVIYISSTSVYISENKTVKETSPLAPSPLVAIEDLFRQNGNFDTTILRFAGLFGYDRNPANFFKNNPLIKNPEGFVNLIHQDDCIQIIQKIIEVNCWNVILNACCDSHPSRRDFYTKQLSEKYDIVPEFDKGNAKYKIISNKKLKSRLNYEFKINDLMKI